MTRVKQLIARKVSDKPRFRARLRLASMTTVLPSAGVRVTPLSAAARLIMLGLGIDGANQEEKESLQAYLTKAMGRPVKVVSPETVACLADGSCDFACNIASISSRSLSPVLDRRSIRFRL
jgi:hypothetical protein